MIRIDLRTWEYQFGEALEKALEDPKVKEAGARYLKDHFARGAYIRHVVRTQILPPEHRYDV